MSNKIGIFRSLTSLWTGSGGYFLLLCVYAFENRNIERFVGQFIVEGLLLFFWWFYILAGGFRMVFFLLEDFKI